MRRRRPGIPSDSTLKTKQPPAKSWLPPWIELVEVAATYPAPEQAVLSPDARREAHQRSLPLLTLLIYTDMRSCESPTEGIREIRIPLIRRWIEDYESTGVSDPTVAQFVAGANLFHYEPRKLLLNKPDVSRGARCDPVFSDPLLLGLKLHLWVHDTSSDEALFSEDPRLSVLFQAGLDAGVDLEEAIAAL